MKPSRIHKTIFAWLYSLLLMMALTVQAQEKPNIIYILCDDLGIGDVGIHNPNGKIPTPNMDRIGREGIVFTDAHSNSGVCTPTRYGILTGRYTWRSQLKRGVLQGYSDHLIEEDRMTVASLLKDNGYHTAYIGKWHLGWDWARSGEGKEDVDFTQPVSHGPNTNGFDYAYGHCGSLDMAPYVYVENGMPTAVPTKTTVRPRSEYSKGWWREGLTAPDFDHWEVMSNFTERSVDYIREQAETEEPFFLYLPYSSPHSPCLPTEEYVGSSGLDSIYADFVTMNDDHIGQVIAAVEAAGISENTLIIVTSDNGCSPVADFKELAGQGHDPSLIYRGQKGDIFEGGHRIPFVARWPAKIKPGSISHDTTCLTDLLATCADILNVDLPIDAGEDSVSMLPNLLGTADGPVREAIVHHSLYGDFAIRQGEWKLIESPHSGGWSPPRAKNVDDWKDLPPIQLYNLKTDPGETTNLYNQYPEVVQRLRRLLDKYKTDDRSAPLANYGRTK
jgi:arylsulfatase A-like enzyme